ncbi:MAG: DUF4836 family protein [Cytophagales bacterium]|nr:DUF4836 family protein [Cytophagales bacterium]MDW8385315.1 DUF4836 family protein [Flammeovirgaceae bacterium]
MKAAYFFLAFTWITNSFSQDISVAIPKSVGTIVALNTQRLSTKVSVDEIFQLPTFKFIDEEIKSLLPGQYHLLSAFYKNPSAVGLNVKPQFYLTFEPINDTLNAYAWLINMSDVKKFENAIQKTLMIFSSTGKIEQGRNYKYIYKDYTGLGWNKKGMILVNVVPVNENMIYEGLDKEADDYYDIIGERKDKLRRRQQQLMKEKLEEMFRKTEIESILSNTNYQLFKIEEADMSTWISSDRLNQATVSAAKANPYLSSQPSASFQKQNEKYLSGSYFHIFTNFNKGEIKSIQRQYVNGELNQVIARTYTKKVNPIFFEYINGQNLLGFISLAVDYQQLYYASTQAYQPLFGENGLFHSFNQTIFQFLEKTFQTQNLSDVFAGDINIAITGAKTNEITYTDFVFDEEFNSKPVVKTKIEVSPLFLVMITTTSAENAQKLIQTLLENQIITKHPTKKIFPIQNQDYIKDAYLFVENNLIFITNETSYQKTHQNVAQLHPEWKQNATQKQFMMIADLKNILLLVSQKYSQEDPSYSKSMGILANELKDIQLQGIEIVGDTYTIKANIFLTDTNKNSLFKLFELIDKVMGSQTK